MKRFDVIVIGVGGMGSATVYHLARRRQRVLGLEQFDIPHDFGSSHGSTRIIRLAYAEGPAYVPLLRRAYTLWRELENLSGERLMVITGGIDAGREDSSTIQGSRLACEQHHLPHERLDAASLQKRFPGYRLAKDMEAVYQPDGGFLMPERCIVNYVMAAQALGAEIHAREQVLDWTPQGEGVEVRTALGSYFATKVVITAGPWASALCPQLSKLAIPERQVVLWAQPNRPEFFRLGSFPIFNMEAQEGRFYGFPVWDIPGFKIGKYHHLRQDVDLNRIDRDVHPEDEEVLREGIRRYFPDANGPTMALKTCLFTNSPDEHFILDLHPDAPNVYIAAGFSGHGFKFCSVIGEIMTSMAIDGVDAYVEDLAMFRLQRFNASL
jgi:sarcosine oxidase